jgi:hypothetical protein
MDANTIIAIYAAVVATGAAGWPIFQWWHRQRPHVDVQAKMGLLTGVDARPIVTITVYNHGDRSIRVEQAGLNAQDGSGRTFQNLRIQPGATIPGIVHPHDSGMTYLYADDIEGHGYDVTLPVVAWASLSSGEHIASKAKPLLARS